ncbi:DNA-binding protein [Brevibacterium zhoupengii]|uniref:DNA-binding protein n=1 Tax=Brevibacterium zhoupengii TaxID=2898795 RepID=UPI001F095548|nr:DNA-binding protein [Brevibacterium zhoupengii]
MAATDETRTPEERAEAAARDLADRGRPVTARAVRNAAGVRMTIAAAVAKAWKDAEAEDEADPVPPVPEDVAARVGAIWADAYRAALAVVSPERDRLAEEVGTLREDAEALTGTVAELEDERDRLAADLETVRQAASEAGSRAEVAERETREVEARATAVEAERDRLADQVTALIERVPALQKGKQ